MTIADDCNDSSSLSDAAAAVVLEKQEEEDTPLSIMTPQKPPIQSYNGSTKNTTSSSSSSSCSSSSCTATTASSTSRDERDDINKDVDYRYTILALYKFQTLENVEQVRNQVEELLRRHEALGGILIATEGINGTICYPTINHNTDTDSCSATTTSSSSSVATTSNTNQDEEAQDSAAVDASDHDHHDNSTNPDDPVYEYLTRTFPGLQTRLSYSNEPVFWRLRVRCKAEIVTLGVPEFKTLTAAAQVQTPLDNHNQNQTRQTQNLKIGTYVSPRDWNALIEDPDTWVIDTRNSYEVQVGTFRRAVDPHTSNFTEFPAWLEQQLQEQQALIQTTRPSNNNSNEKKPPSKIAMFCTGGIRCEKATAYVCQQLKQLAQQKGNINSNISSIPEVYHLRGGILAYLDEMPPEDSLFDGECYVFDRRVAVTHGLRPSSNYQSCHACRHPLTAQDRYCNNNNNGTATTTCNDKSSGSKFVYGVECPHCSSDPERQARRERYQARQRQMQVAAKLGITHLGSSTSTAIMAASATTATTAKTKR